MLKKEGQPKEVLVAKNVIWSTIGKFVEKGAVFFSVIIFSRIMSKEDVGLYSNVSTIYTIFLAVVTLQLAASVMVARFDYKKDYQNYVANILIFGTMIGIAFLAIFHIFFDTFSEFLFIDRGTMTLLVVAAMLVQGLDVKTLQYRFTYDYKKNVVLAFVRALLPLAISVLCTYLVSDALKGRIYGYYLTLALLGGIFCLLSCRQIKGINVKYCKFGLAYSFPLVWHLLAGQILGASDKLVITYYRGAEENAMYSMAYTCAYVISVLWAALNDSIMPYLMEKMSQDNHKATRKVLYVYIGFFLFAAFNFIMLGPEILYVLAGEQYLEAKAVIPVVGVGYIIYLLYSNYVNVESYFRKTKYIAMGTGIAAFLNLGLNILLISKFGYLAAAYTTTTSYVVLLLAHFGCVVLMKQAKWYDNRFVLLVALGSLVSIPLMNMLYGYAVARYALLLAEVIVVAVIGYRKQDVLVRFVKTGDFTVFMKEIGRGE